MNGTPDRDTDGYLARLDRRVSGALTRLLARSPVTPDQVTAAALALALLGAWELAAARAGAQAFGALLLWLSCVLDGCDGELARLKGLGTPEGAAFDLWADHVAHLATFIALPIGAARLHPGAPWPLLGAVLVSGAALSAFGVWRLVLSAPAARRAAFPAWVERVASRDYVYLIAAFAAVERLDLFVWAAALGSHAFWIRLWTLAARAGAA